MRCCCCQWVCGAGPDALPAFAEIYSTGRANLPGAVTERQLLASWSRMLPGMWIAVQWRELA